MTEPVNLDPRINAFRPDLADASLSAQVKAERYVEGKPRQCVIGVVPLLEAPDVNARRRSEVRYGEFLDVFEQRPDGFVWAQNRSDRCVGYLPSPEVLSESIASLANRIKALHTFVYIKPDVKSAPLDRLTLGSYVSVMRQTGPFVELASGGFVYAKHVAPSQDILVRDYVLTAGRLLGVPYLWGGRTPLGLDCSGLVQLSLEIAGVVEMPRDCDQQIKFLGQPFNEDWRKAIWKRGDIVFFTPHHVGIMTGQDHIINANDFAMQVAVEPLVDVIARGYEIIAKGIPPL